MQRIYLRLVFSKIQKVPYFVQNFKKLMYNLIKPALYKKKMKKLLEINKLKLSKKQNIVNSKNALNCAKTMNFTR